MKKSCRPFALILMIFAALTIFPLATHAKDSVRIFAAASTTNAITDISALFEKNNAAKTVLSFASSSTLAKQIEQGAPADIFISANPKWMNYLEEKKAVEPGTRFDLLGNRIVLIVPATRPATITITPELKLAEMLGEGRLAMGDPDHVPAGIYGKQALESLGIWNSVAEKTARAKDVRAALALVEREESPIGLVYATDAAISRKVSVAGTFPEDSHPAITYPAAIVTGKSTPATTAFITFLKSPESKAIFEKYGFTVK